MEQTQKCTRKRGPKPDPHRALLRQMMGHMSDRTFATYWASFRQIKEFTQAGLFEPGLGERLVLLATRPNGTFNVRAYARMTEAAVMEAVRQYDHEQHEAPAHPDERGLRVSGSASATSTLEESS